MAGRQAADYHRNRQSAAKTPLPVTVLMKSWPEQLLRCDQVFYHFPLYVHVFGAKRVFPDTLTGPRHTAPVPTRE
ncbi:hypothetical protein M8C21_024378, partial [Ambrosia artemisiifolia]